MFPAAGTIACWLCLRWPDQYHLPKLVYPSRVLRFDFFVEPVFDLSKPVRNRLFELVEAKPCMWTGRHRSSEAVCLFERLICRRDCSDCEVGHTADFATCDHCPVVNTESYQNLWVESVWTDSRPPGGGREELAALWSPWRMRMRERTRASNKWWPTQHTTLTQSALLLQLTRYSHLPPLPMWC